MTKLLSHSKIHRTVLDNGMVVLASENPAADIIAARIFIKAGSSCEQPHQAGLAHLLAATLTKGCVGLSSLEIAEKVEYVGANLGADTTSDYFLMSLKTVSEDFAEILELAGQMLRLPTFPVAEVELEQRLALQDIRSQQEQPFAIAFEQLRELMYQNHPYSLSALGTETTMGSLTQPDLLQFHQTYFRPDNIIISIVGRITPTDAQTLVEQVFGDWQAPPQPIPTVTLPRLNSTPQVKVTNQPTQQSIIMLGYLSTGVHSSDYAPLRLLSSYLGNGLSSRLFVELREKRGLAYDVSAFYPTRLDIAPFVTYIGTAPENTATALAGLRTEVERLCTTTLEADALQAAKNKILGQYALGKQTNAQIAQVYGWYETLGLGIGFDDTFQQRVAAITAEEAQAVACQYFGEPYVSIVGPEDAVMG